MCYNKILFLSGLFLLLHNKGITQNNIGTELKSQFELYQTNHLQEKIFIHTDKSFYLAGETIWFKAYIVDGFLNRPLPLSKVIYIEVIDKDAKPVLQTKIAVDSSMGSGSIVLPVTVSSGNYIFRAYTNWMKNFDTEFFYQQNITVVNTVREAPLPNDTLSNKMDIQFFPEGGNLVAGLTSKIAFKAVDNNNNGINCQGIVFNNKNDTVAIFKSLLFGMGSFIFTPEKDEQYKAIIKREDGGVITQSLPTIYNTGYVINLDEKSNGQIAITVNATADIGNKPVYLFVQSHQLVKSVQYLNLADGKAVFNVDKKDLADGISHFTVFNGDKKPVCERLYFKQPISKLLITANQQKVNCNLRDSVEININTADELKNPLGANLSMSVFLVDFLQPITYTDIESYLLLSSDLKGKIESPDYYFNTENKDAVIAVDNLMLTQGWSRFKWEDILQNKTVYFKYLPEYEGIILSGKLVNKVTGLPIDNATENVSIPNRSFLFFNATSNTNGNVYYVLNHAFGKTEMIVQSDNTSNNYQLDIENPFSTAFHNNKKIVFNLAGNLNNDLLQLHIGMQLQHSYNIDDNRKFMPLNQLDTTVFYGKPTYSFNLDAFTPFNTMEEVIKEFVTDVQLRKKDSLFYFRVYDHVAQTLFDNDPLLLIDGVPILDANKIVALNPLKIQRIDVVSNKYYLGGATYNGIVSFRTYDGDLGGYQLDPNAVVLQFDGLQLHREFYHPKYETMQQQQSRIPDFRNVLYWNADLKTNEMGKSHVKFFTSDVAGKFAIVIQGITKNGKFGSSISTFQVK